MRDNIPDALIAAFERQYDTSWSDPQLRNERLAMRYGWAAAMEAKQCLHQIQEPTVNQQLTDEREAFGIPQCPFPCGWKNLHSLLVAEGAFLARSLQEDDPITEHQRATVMRVVNYGLEMARAALASTPTESPENVREGSPFDSPEFERLARELGVWGTAQSAICAQFWLAATPAAAPVVLPEPLALYDGEKWYANEEAAICSCADMAKLQKVFIESQLRALLAGVSAPAAQAVPDGWREKFAADVYADLAAADNQDVPLEEYPARILKVLDSIVGPRHPVVIKWRNDAIRNCIAIAYKYCRDPESHKYLKQDLEAMLTTEPAPQAQAVERGEVLVTVSGFTGSGKSAIAGEIEIMCRALGLQVEWPDGESEKNMTHADWTAALEQYKPRVRIVEQNIPFVSKKGLSK